MAVSSSLFVVATNLQSTFTFTPGLVVTNDAGNALHSIINLSGGTPTSADKGSGSILTSAAKVSTVRGDTRGTGGASGDSMSSPSNSNSGFDVVKEKLHPKTTDL